MLAVAPKIRSAKTAEEGRRLFEEMDPQNIKVISEVKNLYPCMESWPCEHGTITVKFADGSAEMLNLDACAAKTFFESFGNRSVDSHKCNCPNCDIGTKISLKDAQEHFKDCCSAHVHGSLLF